MQNLQKNPAFVRKAFLELSRAIWYYAQSIQVTAEDTEAMNLVLNKAPTQLTEAQKKERAEMIERAAKKVKEEARREERELAKRLSREESFSDYDEEEDLPKNPEAKKVAGLPDKPMKMAAMEEFLKGWVEKAKAKETRGIGSFVPGCGCAYQGVEHMIKKIYNNGVALVNRKATQYHRLVPVDQLQDLWMVPTGYPVEKGKYASGSQVFVGYGLKGGTPTYFRKAKIISINGKSVEVKFLDNGVHTSTLIENLKPDRTAKD